MTCSGYKQESKTKVRSKALSHAVTLLTSGREKASCVRNSYVREVKEQLLSKGTEYDIQFAEQLPDESINLWENFHSSKAPPKRPSDLTVCYLCGPEPKTDYDVLLKLGVHPCNIWAFEANKGDYKNAIGELASHGMPMPKIHREKLQQFFINTPQKFDIVYLDCCGPLPSVSQRTLQLVSTLFRHQRLSSPGILITNFSHPDSSNTKQFEEYQNLTSDYLFPKEFIEGYYNEEYSEPMAIEGPVSYSFDPKTFRKHVAKGFAYYYSQYITRQLMDLASCVVPWIRFADSPFWNTFFEASPKVILRESSKMRTFPEDGSGGNVIVDAGSYSIQHFLYSLGAYREIDTLGKYKIPITTQNDFCDRYLREINGLKQLTTEIVSAVACHDLLREETSFYTRRLTEITEKYRYRHSMFQFCDVPTSTLGFDVLIQQLSFPMHYNIDQIRRWSYIAKQTQMFTDAMVFDECRYIYDWLPTIDTLYKGFEDAGFQLCYRFALDGLAKHRRWYNSEYFFGAAVIGQDVRKFEAQYLKPRIDL